MIVPILAAVALLALALFIVAWAKYLDEKEARQKKELEFRTQLENIGRAREVDRRFIDRLLDENEMYANAYKNFCEKNIRLQERLSAELCPTNNHVWINGVCKKCGRIKE